MPPRGRLFLDFEAEPGVGTAMVGNARRGIGGPTCRVMLESNGMGTSQLETKTWPFTVRKTRNRRWTLISADNYEKSCLSPSLRVSLDNFRAPCAHVSPQTSNLCNLPPADLRAQPATGWNYDRVLEFTNKTVDYHICVDLRFASFRNRERLHKNETPAKPINGPSKPSKLPRRLDRDSEARRDVRNESSNITDDMPVPELLNSKHPAFRTCRTRELL